MNVSKVTRLEVIDHRTGGSGVRKVIAYDASMEVELMLQDDGRTLKVRLKDRGSDGLPSNPLDDDLDANHIID